MSGKYICVVVVLCFFLNEIGGVGGFVDYLCFGDIVLGEG